MDLITVGTEQFLRIGSDLVNVRHIERISLDDRTVALASGYIARIDTESAIGIKRALPQYAAVG